MHHVLPIGVAVAGHLPADAIVFTSCQNCLSAATGRAETVSRDVMLTVVNYGTRFAERGRVGKRVVGEPR